MRLAAVGLFSAFQNLTYFGLLEQLSEKPSDFYEGFSIQFTYGAGDEILTRDILLGSYINHAPELEQSIVLT